MLLKIRDCATSLTILVCHKYLSLTSQFHLLLVWFEFKALTQRYLKREYLGDLKVV